MATAAQITANHANSQLCTGPRTDAGKERSSQNALKHGLFSRRVVVPHESQEEYDAMLAEMTDHHEPVGSQESNFVRELQAQRDVGGRQESGKPKRDHPVRRSRVKLSRLPAFETDWPSAARR